MKSYLIAITGTFGSGKSLVSELLNKMSIFTIDSDDIVENILAKDRNVIKKITNEFGDSILDRNNNNSINKRLLADIVFSSDLKRGKLESIIHPIVTREIKRIIKVNNKEKIIVVQIPLLFECKLENMFDEAWCVVCDDLVRCERLAKNGWTKKDIDARTQAQIPQDKKAMKANFIINNSKSINETKEQIIKKLKSQAQLNHNPHLSFDK